MVLNIGYPIVNLPGCVEAHKDSSENQTLTADDDDGLVTYCDAGAPNFYPIDYDASRIEIKQENLENVEKILKNDSIHFDKLGLIEGNEINYGNDLKISIDDIKQGYKKWLSEYMVN